MSMWIITGGIGTGKSTFCQLLKKLGGARVESFSADAVVHSAYEQPEIRQQLGHLTGIEGGAAMTGPELRVRIRQAVADDPQRRAAIEGVLHPMVRKSLVEAQSRAGQGGKVLLAEIPLYYETGAAVPADRVIVVAASRATQLLRLQSSRSLDQSTAEDMLKMQLPLEHKIGCADVVIWNDGSPGALEGQAITLLGQDNILNQSDMEQVMNSPAAEAGQTAAAASPVAESQPSAAPAPAATASGAQDAGGALPEPPFPEEQSINGLQDMSPVELQTLAESVGWRTNASRSKHQLVYDLMGWLGNHRTRLTVDGWVDIGSEGFGLIRYPKYSFAPLPEDVFVPSFLVRKFGLRSGQRITGYVKVAKEKEKYAAIDRITTIEGVVVDQWEQPTPFDKLTALFPSERIILETPKAPSVSSRVVDIVAPLGKGQRALIMASPRSGKTILLKDIAKSITANHPEIELIVLLLDERPEEVTDFEESVLNCQIYSSTFDESPKRHTQVAELVSERARRLVEEKKDVVILLDSITRLARGYNSMMGGKGRTQSGGLDTKALIKPKKFFGAARNVEEGGSLTIVATALVETESRMDDAIFEEFKGTGNMEISLDREMAERRIYPAIHVTKSGTRRDDLLYHPDEFKRVGMIRRQLAAVPAIEALESLIRNLHRTKSNAELLFSGLK